MFLLATEVRCQEKTRGGLRYEVILGEPEVKATPPKKPVSPKNSMSVQDIEEKLKAAEERRQVEMENTLFVSELDFFNLIVDYYLQILFTVSTLITPNRKNLYY